MAKYEPGTRVRFVGMQQHLPPGERRGVGEVVCYGADLSGPGVFVKWDATRSRSGATLLPEIIDCVDESAIVAV